MSKVLGPRSPVLGPRSQVPGPSTQVPGSEPRSQVPVPSPSPWSQVYIYHVPALRAQFPCPTSQFPGPKARGPGPSSHIPRLRSESQGWDPDPKFLFPGRKFQVPNPRYQVEDPCPRSQALGRSHFTSLIFCPPCTIISMRCVGLFSFWMHPLSADVWQVLEIKCTDSLRLCTSILIHL